MSEKTSGISLQPPTLIATSKLKTHPNNPRSIRKEKLEKLKRSISEDPDFMQVRPLLVNYQMQVFAGNQRLRACKDLGWTEVPCHVLGWDEEKQRRAMIKDNVSSGEWDQDMLANDGWDAEELKEWGVPIDWDPVQETEGLTDPDDVPAVPEEPTTKLGDLWILGDHRLLCGDSTKTEDMQRLMDGELADLWLTDPPYNVAYQGGTKEALTIMNDQMSDSNFRSFLVSSYAAADQHMKPGASFYVWHADLEGFNFRGAAHDIGWQVRQCLIWNKQRMVMGRQDYHWKHEPCLYGWKKGAAHNWYNDRKQTTVLQFDRPSRSTEHPTMKPVELVEYCMGNSSTKGQVVLDSFLGSGSTLIAAEKTGRKCYGMELDPKYCDVIVKRWEDFTGKKARLENEEDTFKILTQAH